MNISYLTAANHAAAYERAGQFTLAAKMWSTAYDHANATNKEWCQIRYMFCAQFGQIIEFGRKVDSGEEKIA